DPGIDLALHELSRLLEVVVHDRRRVNAHAVVDGGEQLAWVDRVFQRRRGGLVRFAIHEAAFDPGAGDAGRVAIGPVVPAIVFVFFSGRAYAILRTAAELADGTGQ